MLRGLPKFCVLCTKLSVAVRRAAARGNIVAVRELQELRLIALAVLIELRMLGRPYLQGIKVSVQLLCHQNSTPPATLRPHRTPSHLPGEILSQSHLFPVIFLVPDADMHFFCMCAAMAERVEFCPCSYLFFEEKRRPFLSYSKYYKY
jgi:hypothetical protein